MLPMKLAPPRRMPRPVFDRKTAVDRRDRTRSHPVTRKPRVSGAPVIGDIAVIGKTKLEVAKGANWDRQTG